jgi:hypothetical protein
MVQEDIDEITIQNKIIQQKQKPKQLEIKYLLCNTSTIAYVIKITKNLEVMENIKHEENEETLNDMNIITEHQFNIKNGIIF